MQQYSSKYYANKRFVISSTRIYQHIMPNPYFKFKKFTVFHDKCAMKVGTDGVLLGAWVDTSNAQSMLDVGTGTGLIALMLAQRSEDKLIIDAIDIDKNAIIQTKENIENSPFDKIHCFHCSLQQYASICNKKYDLIVSNPPYFSNSLLSPNQQRTTARHTESLAIEEFFMIIPKLLSQTGRVAIVFPYTEKEKLIRLAEAEKLYLIRTTIVYPTPKSAPKRILMEFSNTEKDPFEDKLIIETERHQYSPEFTALLKDFYLKL